MVRFANLDFDISRFFYEKDLDSFVWFESGKESFIFKAMSQYFINWGHQNVSGSKSGRWAKSEALYCPENAHSFRDWVSSERWLTVLKPSTVKKEVS